MASQLMVTISGVRGVIGESLFPSTVAKYVTAFGVLQKGKKIVIGRDSRVSGPFILNISAGILVALGYEVLDVGIVPTPTVQFLVQHFKADGGLIITSSHNDAMWNGLKFVDSDGLFLYPSRCEEMFALADRGEFSFPTYDKIGHLEIVPDSKQLHIDPILAFVGDGVEEIRKRRFKICLDTVNGAGGPIMKSLLEQLGCEIVGLNLEPTGLFAHKPEPIPEHLEDLCIAVKQHKADLGIAVDPDVDRCVLIDEAGKPLGEEYTLAIAVKLVLGYFGRRGPVCKNLSSSRAVDDVAVEYGCPVYATPVGEINVAKKMVETKSVIGGEGNGGVMLPDIHIGRDAPVAAALALHMLALHRGSLSSLKSSLPQWEIVKLKAPLRGLDPDAAIAKLKEEWKKKPEARLDDSDGLRIDTTDWWVHLRKSNTEPIIRVIGESRSKEQAIEICNMFMSHITNMNS